MFKQSRSLHAGSCRLFLSLPPLTSLFFSAVTAVNASTTQSAEIELQTPHFFGYVIGDLVQHTLNITSPPGYTLERGSLPAVGPYVANLEVRQIEMSQQPRDDRTLYSVKITYQFFKAVRKTETAVIPPIQLRFHIPDNDQALLEAATPAWSYTINPLIPDNTPDDQVTIQPAHPAPLPNTDNSRYRLYAGLASLLTGLFLIARRLDWFSFLSWKPGPFRRAHRRIRQLQYSQSEQDALRQALLLFHEAINEAAGETILISKLDQFFEKQPAFASFKPRTAEFFSLSQQQFFADSVTATTPESPLQWLEQLAREYSLREQG